MPAAARIRLLEPGLPTSEATLEVSNTATLDLSTTAELPPPVVALPVMPKPQEETALASVPPPQSPEIVIKIPAVAVSEEVSAASAAPRSETTSNTSKETQAVANYQAQLAAYPSEARSLNGCRAMVAAYPSQFERFSPSIERIDLGGEKGVFFRLMTGHFGTVDEAKRFCTLIVRSGAASGCIPRPTQ